MAKSRRSWFACLTALIIAGPMAAPAAAADRSPPLSWSDQFPLVEEALRAQQWKRAEKIVNKMLGELEDHVAGRDAPLVGMLLLLRAVSQSGLGDQVGAEWDLFAAATIDPKAIDWDLSAYGEAGGKLSARIPQVRAEAQPPTTTAEAEPKKVATRPKVLKQVKAKYTRALRAACKSGLVITHMIVTAEGRPTRPRVLKSTGGPMMSLAALEALRQWRFQPGEVEGKPVDLYYVLTTHFDIGPCPAR